ncbi:MAG: hypothetical protein WDN45_00510 [Caulobacteraceae bacterium]
MLEGLYRMTADASNAATAAEHVAILQALPPEVVTATSQFSDGEMAQAEQLIRAFCCGMATTRKGCACSPASAWPRRPWTTPSTCWKRC